MAGDGGPPSDVAAEEEVLGALLTDDYAIGLIAGVLTPGDFFIGVHRTVYQVMLALHERGEPTDVSLVRAELEQRGQLDDVGGSGKLTSWITAVPTAVNVRHYAGVVADRALRRRLLGASMKIAALAYEAETGEAAAAQAAAALATASVTQTAGAIVDLADLAGAVWDDVVKAVEARDEGEVVTPGLLTGFPDLDRYSGGMRPGELVLLAARPGMGKTSIAAQIAADVAGAGKRVLVFSLEMPGKDIAGRALWQRSRLDGQAALRGVLAEGEMGRLAGALGELADLPIRVDDSGGLLLSALVSRARTERASRGLDLVVVDYLQLVRGTPRRDGNRVAEVTEISQQLKGLARDLGCPVLALSQLNRQVEHRTSPRPMLSDLRDSGSLEQDADQVWLLWKDDPALPVAQLHVAKNRNGPTGALSLRWDARSTRFDALDTRHA